MSGFPDITAAILSGGRGTRLHPVVPGRQKVLVEILQRPFLHFLMDQLVTAGIRDVVLCTGYMADQVREKIGDTYRSLKVTYSREKTPVGTGGALRLALPQVGAVLGRRAAREPRISTAPPVPISRSAFSPHFGQGCFRSADMGRNSSNRLPQAAH